MKNKSLVSFEIAVKEINTNVTTNKKLIKPQNIIDTSDPSKLYLNSNSQINGNINVETGFQILDVHAISSAYDESTTFKSLCDQSKYTSLNDITSIIQNLNYVYVIYYAR